MNTLGTIPLLNADEALEERVKTVMEILSDPNHPERPGFEAIQRDVETRVTKTLAPVLEAIRASEMRS